MKGEGDPKSVDLSLSTLKTEAVVLWDVLQHGTVEDPVFEGIVREFHRFDASLQKIYNGVDKYMLGVEQLCAGMAMVSEAMVDSFTKNTDSTLTNDVCRYRESTNKITRGDAPHSCTCKLRRNLEYNVVSPLQKHLANNRDIKNSIVTRRHRLNEVQMCKRKIDQLTGNDAKPSRVKPESANSVKPDEVGSTAATSVAPSSNSVGGGSSTVVSSMGSSSKLTPIKAGAKAVKELRAAEANLEFAKSGFIATDRPLFEWLMMLDAYRCDMYDSLLQTMKYVQYEFFAESLNAISQAMPSRMHFRPLVEMTPEELKPQVDLELAQYDENEVTLNSTSNMLKKWERDGYFDEPAMDEGEGENDQVVDALSLASLIEQGFEELYAKRALQLHNNDTQKALDTLMNNMDILEKMGGEEVEVPVRKPTSLRFVKKLRSVRKGDLSVKTNGQATEGKEEELNGIEHSESGGSSKGQDDRVAEEAKENSKSSSVSPASNEVDLFAWLDDSVDNVPQAARTEAHSTQAASHMQFNPIPSGTVSGTDSNTNVAVDDLLSTFSAINISNRSPLPPPKDPTAAEPLSDLLSVFPSVTEKSTTIKTMPDTAKIEKASPEPVFSDPFRSIFEMPAPNTTSTLSNNSMGNPPSVGGVSQLSISTPSVVPSTSRYESNSLSQIDPFADFLTEKLSVQKSTSTFVQENNGSTSNASLNMLDDVGNPYPHSDVAGAVDSKLNDFDSLLDSSLYNF